MKQTPARSQFKKHMGQANHHLVTALVALDTLDASEVSTAPPALHAAWNPRDRRQSVSRSRSFVEQSFLAWAVDSLDMYATLLYRRPNYLQDATLASELDGCGRSVSKKIHCLGAHFAIDPLTIALVDVLITWRNNVFHALTDNMVCPRCVRAISDEVERLGSEHCGLDASDLLPKALKGAPLTFKETASLIDAAHQYVRTIDDAVIARLDLGALCAGIVVGALGEDRGFRDKYYCLPVGKRARFTTNWLANVHGIVDLPPEALAGCVEIPVARG